ncbi:PREDICTED: targeting protein for Xklp2-like [Dinoponera quadriceps]|uniref:Targeting protein for Xklp2-like n=1 Tax=Dinoponera quadriceps TaxID=609295 RepID=A0A6P3XB23_DINQU|nr:PREDICTED: targeting protein for Xklp2-like [Dinoponera quadriceps]
MDSIIGTQWVDFTEAISPPVPMKDYFEKEHAIHGRIQELSDLTTENAENMPINVLCVNKEAQQDLDIIKNTPVKVISPKYRKKTTMTAEITYDQVLTDAMKKLELCKKPLKARSALNKTVQEPNTFKTPNMSIIKLSRSVGCRSVPNNVQSSNGTSVVTDAPQKNDDTNIRQTRALTSYSLSEGDVEEDHIVGEDNVTLHDKTEEVTEEQNDVAMVETRGRAQHGKPRSSVLTWQNGRRTSLNKRRGSSRFVSLAEAVSRFQNETPKRFRTRRNKDLVSQDPPSKKPLMQRLKPTIPISPALVSKNRTRTVTVLSQEEREKREMEEMKKNPIKANPVPLSVLRGPVRATTKSNVTKKPTDNSSQRSMVTSIQPKNPGVSRHDRSSAKNTVTKILVSDPNGILVEHEEIPYFGVPKESARSVTRVVPFSFEARNKDLQMKKEQRLKSLQEAGKTKMEFHARPAPNFSKPPLTTSPPKQEKRRTMVVQQCPFSFETRDKNLPKRKEELAKQMLEEDKRMRVFRANPAPVFKPVMVRGVSKERLSAKEIGKTDDQENEEPNIEKSSRESGKCARKTVNGREEMMKATLELNTDKRARERREFDERLKRKEMEEMAKRQEEKRRQEENEKQMWAEQRKLAEVRARPMPMYKPMIIAKATKMLTEPQSPALSKKHRQAAKHPTK